MRFSARKLYQEEKDTLLERGYEGLYTVKANVALLGHNSGRKAPRIYFGIAVCPAK